MKFITGLEQRMRMPMDSLEGLPQLYFWKGEIRDDVYRIDNGLSKNLLYYMQSFL